MHAFDHGLGCQINNSALYQVGRWVSWWAGMIEIAAACATCLPACVPACLPACLPACTGPPTCLPAYLPARRPACCLPTRQHLPAYLPARPPACLLPAHPPAPACLPACLPARPPAPACLPACWQRLVLASLAIVEACLPACQQHCGATCVFDGYLLASVKCVPCISCLNSCVQEGVGRRVGEQSEWVWSRGKPLFMLIRYMTHAHWWDAINSWLALLSKQLQHELPEVLQKRLKAIDACIGEAQQHKWAASARSHFCWGTNGPWQARWLPMAWQAPTCCTFCLVAVTPIAGMQLTMRQCWRT
jgi:hypothetical protein